MTRTTSLFIRVPRFLLVCSILFFGSSIKTFAQKGPQVPSVDQLKKQFGDKTEVVSLSSTSSYSFEYTKNNTSPVTAREDMDVEYMSLRNNYDLICYFEYDEFMDVDKIRTFDKKDRRTDASIYDLSADDEEGDMFYTGERVKAFKLSFETAGDKGGYTGQTYYSDPKYLIEAYFKDIHPCVEREIKVSVPKWMNIEIKEMNFDGYDIKKTVTTDPKTGNTNYSYVTKNLKAMDYKEHNVPGASYMYPHILMLCKTYNNADGKTVNIISSVADMYNWYHKLVQEAGNNTTTLKPVVSGIIKDKTTDVDKAKALYYWVQDHIKYLAFENGIAGNKPDACQNVLQKKFGDCKCMANLLVEMLKLAGLDARRTWLGTKGIAYDYSTPCLAVNNHCICTLILNGKHYYLDATEKYAAFGDNADRIQGRQVLVEDGDKYVLETIPVASIDRSKTEIDKTFTVNGELISGDAHYTYNGESKTDILNFYHDLPTDKRDENIRRLAERDDADLSTSKIATSDLENREIPLKLSYDFNLKNQASQFDKDLYVTLDYDRSFQYYSFDSTRLCDYEFPFKYNIVVNDTLIVPQGYTVKHMPDNIDKETPNYMFKLTFAQSGNKVIYHKQTEILNEIVNVKDFPIWNEAIGALKKTYDDQIVLTKK